MKSQSSIKLRLVLFLCVMLTAGVMIQAANGAEATGRCTNIETEGIEYFSPMSVLAADANDWRRDLEVTVKTTSGASAGEVIAMEIEATTNSTRYQCTEITPGTDAIFSCNSFPTNAIINGVYLRYKPDSSVAKDTAIKFVVSEVTNSKTLMVATANVEFPPTPCSRNILTKDLLPALGDSLVYNTSTACTDHKEVYAYEQADEFAIVNIIQGDSIDPARMMVEVSPNASYDYDMEIHFMDALGNDQLIEYGWSAANQIGLLDTGGFATLDSAKLPLTLNYIKIYNFNAISTDLWGNPSYPTSTNFDIKIYYENTAGTLGFENSIFHVERTMNLQFAPYCDNDATSSVMSGVAASTYDPCQTSRQMFSVSLTDINGNGIVVPKSQSDCDAVDYCTDIYSVKPTVHDYSIDHKAPSASNYYFVTRKCRDAACTSYTTTSAYPYSITFSDALSMSRTYKHDSNSSGSITRFKLRAYDDTVEGRPFAITGTRFVATEPGTYVVFGFVDNNYAKSNDLQHYAVKFYVTVNESNDLTTCSTLANNGYFRASWNDCLSFAETQLMPFEHIEGTEEAWVLNRSNHGVHFPYVAEWSYLPQKMQIGSLNCKFEAIASGANPGTGYCTPEDVYVPAYTKVTITSGTIYLAERPEYDDYYVAYMREDTYNISHLFFSIGIKACENVKKIPDTGISLRSPLKVNESVDAATSYVFTGNSLRIPAIGLGMETPIPIVHVYYEDGSDDLGWDLSTLGNYVGELEGGSYLPYAGNSALTGHYYSAGVFKNLENLNLEDEIIIFGNDGIKYIYKVVQKFQADPSDVYEMFQQIGERSLTLVTCGKYNLVTDEYERRTLIRATIYSTEPYYENF